MSIIPLSLNASITNDNSPFLRYLKPPCTSFVLLEEVPFPKSYSSINRTFRPLLHASNATPNPLAPPPITMRSQLLLELIFFKFESRFIHNYFRNSFFPKFKCILGRSIWNWDEFSLFFP